MQYIISEEEMTKLRRQSREVVENLRKALLDYMAGNVEVRLNAEDPFYTGAKQFTSMSVLVREACRGSYTGETERAIQRAEVRWQPVVDGIKAIFAQAEKEVGK